MRLILLILATGAISPLTGCAHQFLAQAQNQCSAFGFTLGTNEYASCVQQQYAAGQARFQQGLANAQQSIGQNSYSNPTSGGASMGTAFLRSSYISGMNRICIYNRMGSQFVTTIGSAEICPLTVP